MIAKVRAWARVHVDEDRYSPVGVAFHWTIAALVFFQLWWGWRMGGRPAGYDKLEAYELHSQVGLLILVLTLLRMAWRLVIPGPFNDADKPGWQSAAAHLTHFVFYACLVGLPLSGWAIWSAMAAEQGLSVAGVLPWPHLPLHELPRPLRWAVLEWGRHAHFALVLTLLALIPMHVGAALKHHFWDKDDVLAGMLPVSRSLVNRAREDLKHRPTPPRSPRPSNAG